MELKMKYQYTYFVYPYEIDKTKYDKYILSLLKNKNCEYKIFEKEKDMGIYTYFLPRYRDYIFPTFEFRGEKLKDFEKLNLKLKSKIIANQCCSCFTYNLSNSLKGKVNENEGIFFNIDKIEIICFNTGICFFTMKTVLDGTNDFRDLLNFNYKFRDINSEFDSLKKFENINVQTDSFKDVKEISDLITEITGVRKDKIEKNNSDLSDSRFYTYSYVCVDAENWNDAKNIDAYSSDFYKFASVLPSNYFSDFNKENLSQNLAVIDKYKYYRIPITKQSANLICSGIDNYNYTELPFKYENEYFYTYIISLYQKMFLRKINNEFKDYNKISKMKRDFIKFTDELWKNEITLDDNGTKYYKTLKEVLELECLYDEIKNKYDIIYKSLNIEKNNATFLILIILLICSFGLNFLNIIMIIYLL